MKDYGFSTSRLEKRERLIKQGVDPYPNNIRRTHYINDILQMHEKSTPQDMRLVGRLIQIKFNDLTTLKIEDTSGTIQIRVDADMYNKHRFLIENLDPGDFISVTVHMPDTSKPQCVNLSTLSLVTKALIDLPNTEKWITDKEAQRKRRYVDLAIREDARKLFRIRVDLIRHIRRFLNNQGMSEVETPVLRSWYDIVCFDQFSTTDISGRSLFMRLCHEDRLKQLLAGGFEKVYELGKSFRRDNFSWKHSPEFLQLETIQAYTDYKDMMTHAEELYSQVTQATIGTTTIKGRCGDLINLSLPWRRISVRDAILEYTGIDIYEIKSADALAAEMVKLFGDKSDQEVAGNTAANPPADAPIESVHALPPKPYNEWFWSLVEHCVGTFVEHHLIQPTILFDYPLDSNWLVKRKSDDPEYIERFEAYIDGIEVANCYSLVNDPVDFVERLEDSLDWYCGAFGQGERPLDLTLIEAKAYGLPPMSESSFGIERWLMIICEQETIHDVIWFPFPYI